MLKRTPPAVFLMIFTFAFYGKNRVFLRLELGFFFLQDIPGWQRSTRLGSVNWFLSLVPQKMALCLRSVQHGYSKQGLRGASKLGSTSQHHLWCLVNVHGSDGGQLEAGAHLLNIELPKVMFVHKTLQSWMVNVRKTKCLAGEKNTQSTLTFFFVNACILGPTRMMRQLLNIEHWTFGKMFSIYWKQLHGASGQWTTPVGWCIFRFCMLKCLSHRSYYCSLTHHAPSTSWWRLVFYMKHVKLWPRRPTFIIYIYILCLSLKLKKARHLHPFLWTQTGGA